MLEIRSLPPSPSRKSKEFPQTSNSSHEESASQAEAHPQKGGKLGKILAGTGLALTGLASLIPSHPEPVPELVVGYSGDAELEYDQVAEALLDTLDLLDIGRSYQVEDLQDVAANQNLPEVSRLAAQEVLADPILLNSLDVAGDSIVDQKITAEDLARFSENHPDAGAFTFLDLERQLHRQVEGTSAFDYFDTWNKADDKFSKQDLQQLRSDSQTPELFQEVAGNFLDNPNLFNGFDVARASFRPGLFDHISGRQRLDGIISRDDVQEIRYSPTPEAELQFTDEDRAALERISQGGELSPDLFTAFRQTDRGNCVATGVIKAAMDHYGGNVLAHFEPNDQGGYSITMQDGYRLELTGQELEAGATASHYAGTRNDTKSYANLLFTSAAKRAQLEGHEGAQTFGQSLLSLNNGENAKAVPRFLGLQHLVKPIKLSEVPGQSGVVVYGGGHAYYVDTVEGQTLGDRWGTATEFQGKAHVNEGVDSSGAYVLR